MRRAPGHVRERLHFERPVTPLFGTLVLPATERGYRAASEAQGGGAGEIELVVEGGYVYTAWLPLPTREVEGEPLPALVERWEREHVPETRATLEDMRALFRAEVPARRAAGELDALAAKLERLLTLHYEVGQTTRAAMAGFGAMLRARGDERAELTVATLLAPCDSLQRDVDAWLAGVGARDPTRDALWPLVRDRPARLDLDAPTWGEDPSLALRAARASDAKAFEAGTSQAVAARRAAEEVALARFSEDERPIASMILAALRRARGTQQTLNLLVGEIALGAARGALLRAGGRVGVGADVVWLTRDELRDALAGEPLPRGLVERRRAEHAAAARATPPDVVGAPDPAMLADPAVAAMLGTSTRPAGGVGGRLRGLGASPGAASGPARLVERDADVDAVRPGDVVVVAALEPTWTPVMQKAAAVVAETGGLLCHAAVVAREMGKPAVVGVPDARRRLRSGERVWVDGASGEIAIGEKA